MSTWPHNGFNIVTKQKQDQSHKDKTQSPRPTQDKDVDVYTINGLMKPRVGHIDCHYNHQSKFRHSHHHFHDSHLFRGLKYPPVGEGDSVYITLFFLLFRSFNVFIQTAASGLNQFKCTNIDFIGYIGILRKE